MHDLLATPAHANRLYVANNDSIGHKGYYTCRSFFLLGSEVDLLAKDSLSCKKAVETPRPRDRSRVHAWILLIIKSSLVKLIKPFVFLHYTLLRNLIGSEYYKNVSLCDKKYPAYGIFYSFLFPESSPWCRTTIYGTGRQSTCVIYLYLVCISLTFMHWLHSVDRVSNSDLAKFSTKEYWNGRQDIPKP